jgi:hypothetical protein
LSKHKWSKLKNAVRNMVTVVSQKRRKYSVWTLIEVYAKGIWAVASCEIWYGFSAIYYVFMGVKVLWWSVDIESEFLKAWQFSYCLY